MEVSSGKQRELSCKYERMISLSTQLAYKLKVLLVYYERITKCQEESLEAIGVIRKRLSSLALDTLHVSDPALSEPSDSVRRIRLVTESVRGQEGGGCKPQGAKAPHGAETPSRTARERIAELQGRLAAAERELEALQGP